jgi:hypothetical protein
MWHSRVFLSALCVAPHNAEELDVVVEETAKTDTNMPIFKVRVVNKGYAGQEMWIAATVLKRSAHLIDYSK